jgi:hypothetical protein
MISQLVSDKELGYFIRTVAAHHSQFAASYDFDEEKWVVSWPPETHESWLLRNDSPASTEEQSGPTTTPPAA